MSESRSFDLGAPEEAYRVLARKYRPSDFTGLIGQEALVRTLSNAFATGRIAHAFMLTGVRGVGKTTTARIIARALNCIGPDGKRTEPTIHPCGVCDPCVTIAESRNVDVQEMDAASNNGVDEVRQIIEAVRYAPASSRYKVYILDEVHMLSKPAFNAILKTLEEPPPHVKFIFATTEIRKVPVTVLSRCQRFDLRRIEAGELAQYLGQIAAKENVQIEEGALALISRAAEGSARDALSLLDQAIAHNEKGAISAETMREMLGLADRGRVLDLFEKVMGGDVPAALNDLGALYGSGADPLAVMQDLLEVTHFLTRLKVAPAAQGFFDGASSEARRAADLAAKLQVSSLTRAWQMLLKGLFEVRDAVRPISACEMALIRLAYAAELPPTDRLVKDLMDGNATPVRTQAPTSAASSRAPMASAPKGAPALNMVPAPAAENAPTLRALEDIALLAQKNGAPVLKVHIENDMHLVKLEAGRLEFRPSPRAPRSLAGDLQQKLRDWTGARWTVSISNEPGQPTLAEAKKNAKAARIESVMQAPVVRAVLDRFPGAEIAAVRDVTHEDAPLPQPEMDE
ncbi:MAG TPA: DNA polymerase III subunit gamma/tau [Rhizomicrobium sp.]|nr:DNA polymerase III subunit gamma/tau [Rhizomicrobium sp.]